MNKLSLFLVSVFLVACSSSDDNHEADHSSSISSIENNIQPLLQVKGENITKWTIDNRLKELNIPGLSIAVVIDGELAWNKAYGYADVLENRQVTEDTYFLAGSVSKPVSALAALQMSEEGKIGLDQNVNELLKSWNLPDNEFTTDEKVTLRRILNHTAGLTVWGFPGYDKGDTIPTPQEVLDGKGNTDSVRVYKKPGESWRYSGGGYTIMQVMMSDLEAKSFPEIMETRVLTPLGMNVSTFENPLPEKYHGLAATGYRSDGVEVEGKWPIYPEMAAAGLWTTPNQLANYLIHVNQVHDGGDGIISNSMADEMLTPGYNGHGLGPGISEDSTQWGHGGADEGFRTLLTSWFEGNHGIVIMCNSDNGTILNEVVYAIANEYGWPGVELDIRESILITDEKGKQLSGVYTFDFGDLTIGYEDGKLRANAPFLDSEVLMIGENDTTFFDRSDGTRFHFKIENDIINAVEIQGYTGIKK